MESSIAIQAYGLNGNLKDGEYDEALDTVTQNEINSFGEDISKSIDVEEVEAQVGYLQDLYYN